MVRPNNRTPTGNIRNLLVVGVPFSENLGDQLIASCTRHLIQQEYPKLQVEFLDLSGRKLRNDSSVFRHKVVVALFYRVPPVLRRAVVAAVLPPYLLLRHACRWSRSVRTADFILVGGGQLLQDINLNFPFKLFLITHIAERLSRTVSIFAVGADARTSRLGQALLRRVLGSATVRGASCRDDASREAFSILARQPLSTPRLAPDPALFAPFIYEENARQPGLVGLNITSPAELASAASNPAEFTEKRLLQFWQQVVDSVTRSGSQVLLFTNGAPLDQAFADLLLNSLVTDKETYRPKLAARPQRSSELVKLITRCDSIVAHRLHACILAAAFQRRLVGIAWDPKVSSFFSLLGESNACLVPAKASGDAVLKLLAHGVPIARHARLTDLRSLTIGALHEALGHPSVLAEQSS